MILRVRRFRIVAWLLLAVGLLVLSSAGDRFCHCDCTDQENVACHCACTAPICIVRTNPPPMPVDSRGDALPTVSRLYKLTLPADIFRPPLA